MSEAKYIFERNAFVEDKAPFEAPVKDFYSMVGLCAYYPICQSPICPIQPKTWTNTWRIGEQFCYNRKYRDIVFVRAQCGLYKYKPADLMDVELDLNTLHEYGPKYKTMTEAEKDAYINAKVGSLGVRQ